MRSHGGEGKPLRGPRLRGDGRLRGDRLRAQAHGPPQPPLRTQTLQRVARGDEHVPELAREDVEGTRGSSDRARCPNCGSFALYVDPVRGERVCDNCGFVVDESLVDQGPDWTTFEGDDRIRAGPPPSVMAPDKGLGSMVGNGLRDAKGNPIDARSVAALNRLRRVSRWTRYDRTERALAPGLAQLSSLSSRLGLAPAFRERAAILLRKAIEAGVSPGRSVDGLVWGRGELAPEAMRGPRGLPAAPGGTAGTGPPALLPE